MTDKTLASITAATALDGTEHFYGTQAGADANITTGQIKTLAVPATLKGVFFTANGGNQFYVPRNLGTVGSSNSTATNTIRGFLGVIDEKITISALGCQIATVSPANNIQLAIYNDDISSGQHRPGTLIDNTANLSTASLAFVSGALSANQQIGPGAYWFCANQSDGVAIATPVDKSSFSQSIVLGSTTGANLLKAATMLVGVTTPGTFTSSATPAAAAWPGTLVGNTFTEAATGVVAAVAFKIASVP